MAVENFMMMMIVVLMERKNLLDVVELGW